MNGKAAQFYLMHTNKYHNVGSGTYVGQFLVCSCMYNLSYKHEDQSMACI
jgi:hypothetical protein